MAIERKPCPHCGCENIVAEVSYSGKRFAIYCEECPAKMELSFADAQLGNGGFISFYEMQKIMYELVEAWNRRTDKG